MNETNKKYIAWIIVVIAVLVAGFLGVTYPIPAPPVSTSQALMTGGIKCHSVGPTGNCVEVWNGGDIRIYSNQGTTSKFSVDGATGDTTVAGNLAISGSTVNGGVIGNNTAITGTLTVTGTTSLVGIATTTAGLAVGGNLTVTGVATFSGFNVYDSASITPTESATLTFTPTAFLVTLTPAGAVGIALSACTSGQWTVLYNSVNANVVITDTGNGVLAGNQTLGQYDTLPLACFGAKWVQVGAVSAN